MGGLWRVLNRELVGSDLQLQRWSWVSENGAGEGGGGEARQERNQGMLRGFCSSPEKR